MSVQNHLAELEKRHQALQAQIETTLACPSADELKLAELKRKKLQLKDEITRVRESLKNSVLH